jgi:uncharacterized protein
MKRSIITAAFIISTLNVFAQAVDLRRKIEVTGTAEQEVTPDIINVSISLQEYLNGKNKVTIDVLENQLEEAVKTAGIPHEDFTINNLDAWSDYYQKKKSPDFLASKQYLIRLHDLDKFNQVLANIDPKGIQSTSVASYSYSKIADLKNELQLRALQSAQKKAAYLLDGIGDKLGDVINISFTDNSNAVQPRALMYSNVMMNSINSTANSDIDFKKIKLVFTADATFEIVK